MYTVIVADDQERICSGLASLIAQFSGLKLIGAYRNGSDVLQALETQVPDILITDIHMPGADGLEICRRVRAHSAATQIILISGYKKFEYARDAIHYNVHSYLVKPYAMELLINAIKDAVQVLDKKQTEARSLTEMYFMKWEQVKRTLSNVFWEQNGVEALGACMLLAQTTKAKDCRVCEISFSPAASPLLQEFEFDSFHLSSFLMADGTLILFYKDTAYKDAYIADCKKSIKLSNYTLQLQEFSEMDFNAWGKFCKMRQLALSFINALKTLQVNGFIAAHEAELTALPHLEDFFSITLMLLKEPERVSFVPQRDKSVEENILAFYDAYLSVTGDVLINIQKYIGQFYADSQLSVEKIADHFKLSRSYISGWYAKKTGKTLTDYINDIRIAKAQELLLEQSHLTHETIAGMVGYNSLSYFYRIFKKRLRITPLQFQKKVK